MENWPSSASNMFLSSLQDSPLDLFKYMRKRDHLDMYWRSKNYKATQKVIHNGEGAIALTSKHIITGGRHVPSLKVWDKDLNLKYENLIPHKSWIKKILVVNQTSVLTASNDFLVKMWSFSEDKEEMLKEVRSFDNNRGVVDMQFKDNVLVCGCAGRLNFWDLTTGQRTLDYNVAGQYFRVDMVHMIDANVCFTAATDYVIRQWDTRTPKCVKEYLGHDSLIMGMEVADSHMTIASSCASFLKVWDINMQTLRTSYDVADYNICSIAYDPFKDVVYSGSLATAKNKGIFIWDMQQPLTPTPTLLGTPSEQHEGSVAKIYCDSKKLISGGKDSRVKIWDLETHKITATENFVDSWVSDLIVTEDRLYVTSSTGELLIMHFSPPRDADQNGCTVQ